tara:strand:- start:194 stop:508 length:315 start_codon:yes stop_codon:yes gene_type:complete
MSLLDDYDFNNNIDDIEINNQIEEDLIDINNSINKINNNLEDDKKLILNYQLNYLFHIFGYIFRKLDYYKKIKCAFLFWVICGNYFTWMFYKNKIEEIKYLTNS